MSNLNIQMENTSSDNFRIFLPNNVDYSWKDEDIAMDIDRLQIRFDEVGNTILIFNKQIYYGWVDDGQMAFTIPSDVILNYCASVISKLL